MLRRHGSVFTQAHTEADTKLAACRATDTTFNEVSWWGTSSLSGYTFTCDENFGLTANE